MSRLNWFSFLWICLFTAVGLAIEPTAVKDQTLGDVTIHYKTYGKGLPLLLLHGYGSNGSEGWDPFIEQFAAHFLVVVPDLRGHGRSTNPLETFTHRQAAVDMYRLMDSLDIDRFKAMGISTGGMTLLHMATTDRSRVEAMVLIGATHYFPESARDQMRRVTGKEFFATNPYWGDERMKRIHTLGAEQIDKLRRNFHGFKDSYDDMNFTPAFLGSIKARTLILHGDRDEFFPIEIPVELYTSIPRSSLWIVPDAGHVAIYDPENLFQPAKNLPFVERTIEFLMQ